MDEEIWHTTRKPWTAFWHFWMAGEEGRLGEALQRNEIAYLYSFTATFLIASE